jgi:uncharacterized cupin superfamily protein
VSDDFSVVVPADLEPESFDTVDVSHRKYTEALGCTDARVNYLALEPGEAVTPHAHERQEELFVPLTGGQIEIDGDRYDVPRAASCASVPSRSVTSAIGPTTRPTSGS